jgi:hypothetical protein
VAKKPMPAPAPVEAGAVETEQRTEKPVQSDAEHDVVQFPTADPNAGRSPTEADLTGPEVAEIRARSESVDKASKAVNDAREAWVQASRLAQYGQEALTVLIRERIIAKGLDGTLRYRVDMDRGKIVPVGPNG